MADNRNESPTHEDVERFYQRLAEACVIRERANLEMQTSQVPAPEHSDEFIKKMNALMADLDREAEIKTLHTENRSNAPENTQQLEVVGNRSRKIPKLKKLLAVAAVLVCIACVPVIAVANGIDFLELFRHESTESVDIYYHNDDSAVTQKIWRVTALPDGYVVIDQDINPTRIQTIYGNPNNSSLPKVELCQYETAPNMTSVDNEGTQQTTVEIQGSEAICLIQEYGVALMWENKKSGIHFELIGNLDVDVLLDMANSVRKY